MGIVERIGALSGTEAAKAVNFAHEHFQTRMDEHGHFGRSLVETVAEVCRNHPNLVGIGAGLAVEQLLAHEKRHHDAMAAAGTEAGSAARPLAMTAHGTAHPHAAFHNPLPRIRLETIKPGRIALEVFGALVLLKFGSGLARAFKKRHGEVWFAPAAKIHLFSGALAAYYLAKAVKSPKVSAWRNAAVALFVTDALKPVLKARPAGAAGSARPAPAPAPVAPPPPPPPPAPEPQPAPVEPEPPPFEAAPTPTPVEPTPPSQL